jgi:hypothetical protein
MSDQEATKKLKEYLDDSRQKEIYPGFSTLPKNVTSLNQVTVIRK